MPRMSTEEKVAFLRAREITAQEYARRVQLSITSVHIHLYQHLVVERWDFTTAWQRAGIVSAEQAERQLSHMVRMFNTATTANQTATQTGAQTTQTIPETLVTINTRHAISVSPQQLSKEYGHNIAVGFEFEMKANGSADITMRELCRNFNIKEGKSAMRQSETNARLDTPDGSSMSMKLPIFTDAYKSPELVTCCYHDGSVGPETVTRPVHIDQLDNDIKPIFEYLKTKGNFNSSQAGLHMTFVLDTHKEKSIYRKQVVQNIMQLVRLYYPALVAKYKNPATTRLLGYRKLPDKHSMEMIATEKYCGCNLRKDRAGNIWAIEMRIPDGTDDWQSIKTQVLIYASIIRHAAMCAAKGRITIPRNVWTKIQMFASRYERQTAADLAFADVLATQMKTVLEPEMKFFTYEEPSIINYPETTVEGE